MKKLDNVISCIASFLSLLTLTSALFLSSPSASADNSVNDDITIDIPITCNLSSTVNTAHTASVVAGSYTANIGKSTIKAACNDNEGFAIYAIGYSNDEYGNTNLIGTTDSTNTMPTDTITSGYASGWAMKLTPVSGTYTPTIVGSTEDPEKEQSTPDFSSYTNIPSTYTKVAYKNSATDTSIGASLETTYAVYVKPTQPADTYEGQVKYTIVHPSTALPPLTDNQIGVLYDGNGLTFEGGNSTNYVVYEKSCSDEYGYVGDTPAIMKTSNLDDEGNQDGAYDRDYEIYLEGYPNFENADKLKVEVYYKINYDTTIWLYGNGLNEIYSCQEDGCEETITFVTRSQYLSGYYDAYGETNPDYDYGVYIKVYPIYNEPTEGATYGLVRQNVCTFAPIYGAYEETTTWNDYWYDESGNTFYYESTDEYGNDYYSLTSYLDTNEENLLGTNIELYSNNSYTVIFDANGGSDEMANQELYPYQNYQTLNESTYTKPHQEVIRWTTEADGTGESYEVDSYAYVYNPILGAKGGDTVTLYAQWGACAPYSICYDDNGANSPTTMGRQNARYLNSEQQNFWPSNFQRPGYGFAGWNTEADGTGTKYGPNANFDTEQSSANLTNEGVRMYAMWIPSAGNFQNWSGCSNINIGDVTALTDTRDNDTYAVAKLADGNCWMIENLRLGSTSPITLTTQDTHTAGMLPASTNSFGTVETERYMTSQNTDSAVQKMTTTDSNVYSYGNLYSWAAAINSAEAINNANVDTSICPTNWHLPYGGNDTGLRGGNTNGGFWYLGDKLSATQSSHAYKWRSYPNNFLRYGGYYSGSSFKNRNSNGYYYTPFSFKQGPVNFASLLSVGGNYFSITINQGVINMPRSEGRSVRCVMNSNE